MLGTIVNAVAIIIGGAVGNFIRGGIKDKYSNIIFEGLGLCTILIGIMGAVKTQNMLLLIMSIVIGGVIGEWLGIEMRLERLGKRIESSLGGQEGSFSKGFITATLLYCVGSMAIVGALESGLTGNHQLLFTKAVLDGVTALIFSSTLGIGVAFSAVPVFLYQGGIALGAGLIKPFLTDIMINEISATGALLIVGIGIKILNLREIKVGNLLPAILIPVLYYLIFG